MGDILDKETKLFLLVLAGILVLMLFVYPKLGGDFFKFNPTNLGSITSSPSTSVTIDKKKDYKATVSTTKGDFKIDLFELTAPANVSNFVNQKSKYTDAKITIYKNFVFKVDAINDSTVSYADEINADSLGLNDIKVKDADFLSSQYDPEDKTTSIFSPEALDKYKDYTVKQFYAEIFKYQYTDKVTTPKAKKYTVYMTSKGPNTNKTDFFILMSDDARHIDGRFTPIGQVSDGFDVVDKINDYDGTDLKVNNISIESL